MINPFDDRSHGIKTKIAIIYILLIAANVASWTWAWIAFAKHPALLGTAFIAYMLGLRHAFDADHIAAIDNVVRKLLHDGKQPLFVGFFFSLGHSSIVVLACSAIVAAATVMHRRFDAFHNFGSVIGTTASALFLLIIGVANLVVLKGIWVAFSRARSGEKIIDEQLGSLLAGRGFLAHLFRRTFRMVSRSWHMYPIGLLFGLGFDTATEIGLLSISAGEAAKGLPAGSILVFPALFTAAMSLLDTTDSVLMTGVYGWVDLNPARKLWFNLTITAASVVAALFIGGLEALGLIGNKLGLHGGVWNSIVAYNENLGNVGFAVVGIFALGWVISAAIYRFRNYDRLRQNTSRP